MGQLQKSGISYHDKLSTMTLIKDEKTIAYAKRNCNLFTLNAAILGQVMSTINKAMAITR